MLEKEIMYKVLVDMLDEHQQHEPDKIFIIQNFNN